MSDLPFQLTCIETPRLHLRPLAATDAAAITALANNWKVVRNLGRLPFPYEEHHADAFLARMTPQTVKTTFALCLKADALPLAGVMGFHAPDAGVADHFGYWLGEPHWGRGLASEAAAAAIVYARQILSAREVRADCRPCNPASRRVLEKCGFVECGKGTMTSLPLGREVPVDRLVLDEAGWRARPGPAPQVTIHMDGGCASCRSGERVRP